MRRSTGVALLGVALSLGGFMLALASSDGGGMVVQDDYHRSLMQWGSIITVVGVFTTFIALMVAEPNV